MHYFYMYAKDPPTIPVVCRRVSLTNPFSKTMPDPEDSGVGGCSAPGEEDDELFWYIPMTDSHGTGILYT